MTRRAPGAMILASFALVALAACGDNADTDEASEAEAWADDVCVAVAQWQGELETARATINDTANLSAAALEDAITGVTTATEELAGDLGGLGAPGTEAGDRAREEVTSLSAALDEQRQALADAVTAPASGVEERRDQVSAVVGALRTMVTQTQATVQELRNLDGAEELSQAFADAPGCEEIR
jgi:hypothetical protein